MHKYFVHCLHLEDIHFTWTFFECCTDRSRGLRESFVTWLNDNYLQLSINKTKEPVVVYHA